MGDSMNEFWGGFEQGWSEAAQRRKEALDVQLKQKIADRQLMIDLAKSGITDPAAFEALRVEAPRPEPTTGEIGVTALDALLGEKGLGKIPILGDLTGAISEHVTGPMAEDIRGEGAPAASDVAKQAGTLGVLFEEARRNRKQSDIEMAVEQANALADAELGRLPKRTEIETEAAIKRNNAITDAALKRLPEELRVRNEAALKHAEAVAKSKLGMTDLEIADWKKRQAAQWEFEQAHRSPKDKFLGRIYEEALAEYEGAGSPPAVEAAAPAALGPEPGGGQFGLSLFPEAAPVEAGTEPVAAPVPEPLPEEEVGPRKSGLDAFIEKNRGTAAGAIIRKDLGLPSEADEVKARDAAAKSEFEAQKRNAAKVFNELVFEDIATKGQSLLDSPGKEAAIRSLAVHLGHRSFKTYADRTLEQQTDTDAQYETSVNRRRMELEALSRGKPKGINRATWESVRKEKIRSLMRRDNTLGMITDVVISDKTLGDDETTLDARGLRKLFNVDGKQFGGGNAVPILAPHIAAGVIGPMQFEIMYGTPESEGGFGAGSPELIDAAWREALSIARGRPGEAVAGGKKALRGKAAEDKMAGRVSQIRAANPDIGNEELKAQLKSEGFFEGKTGGVEYDPQAAEE